MKRKMAWKRMGTLLLAIVMLLSLSAGSGVLAYAAAYSGECGENIKWEFDSEKNELIIEGTGDMYDFYEEKSPWYSLRQYIKSVVISDGITSIGACAFENLASMKSVVIPDSVTSIGAFSFYHCSYLLSVDFPENLSEIDSYAFYECGDLTEIVIPDNITIINDYVFYRCTSLKNIVLPEGVERIGEHAFSGCIKLENVLLPETVKELGVSAFSSCSSLTEFIIPNGITIVDSHLFDQCTNLTEVEIPDSVTKIESYAFYGCENLKNISIPEAVESIGDFAFAECVSFAAFEAPSRVISLGNFAFYKCANMQSIILPKSIEKIGQNAFQYCISLTDIYYYGSENDWNYIDIDSENKELFSAEIHYSEFSCIHNYEWIEDNGFLVKHCTECEEELLQLQFVDLESCEEYGDYIEYTSVFNEFIMGTNPPVNNVFSPRTAFTRAMLVTILYRMADSPYDNGNNPYKASPFTDIKDTKAYYYNAACWALDEGVTTEKTFKPFDNVTREQTAAMLFRYAKANDMIWDEDYTEIELEEYPDSAFVHKWAVEPLQWANYNSMITGTQQGYLNPQGATQRVHAAKILYGFGMSCGIGNFE